MSIKTYVLEFDEDAIKAAIEKELARQGQVFFVHDRVRSIYSIAHLVAASCAAGKSRSCPRPDETGGN